MILASPSRLDGPLRHRLESALTGVDSPFSAKPETLNGTPHGRDRDINFKLVAQHLSQLPLRAVGDVDQRFLEQLQCRLGELSAARDGDTSRRWCNVSLALPSQPTTDAGTAYLEPPRELRVGPLTVVMGFYNTASERDGMGAGHRNLQEEITRSAHGINTFAGLSTDRVQTALETIREIFQLERRFKDLEPEERARSRRESTAPILASFRIWCQNLSFMPPPRSPLAKATAYVLRQWKPLTVFVDNGHIPAHNNYSELALRQAVIGRKNYMFAGSEGGAKSAAIWYSLIGSCLLDAVDPWMYLNDVLPKLNDWPVNRVLELEPAAWRASQLQSIRWSGKMGRPEGYENSVSRLASICQRMTAWPLTVASSSDKLSVFVALGVCDSCLKKNTSIYKAQRLRPPGTVGKLSQRVWRPRFACRIPEPSTDNASHLL